MRASLLLAGLLALAACSSATKRPDGGRSPSKSADITLFFSAELRGTLEPCGCNSDPLGDIARTAASIEAARKERPVALFDGGSTLYLDAPLAEEKKTQAELTADEIAKLLPQLGLQGSGLGRYDLARGVEGLRFARQAANVTGGGAKVEPPRIVDVGGVKVGVFGVVGRGELDGVEVGDPLGAAEAAIAALRKDGAQIVVAIASMSRADAKQLARAAPGADLVLVGKGVRDEGAPAPEAVGQSFLIEPGNRGQVLSRLDLHVEGAGGPLVDAVGPERATAEVAKLDERITRLTKDLAGWEKDPNAEKAFVETNRQELARLTGERDAMKAQPLRTPASGSWFVLRPLRVNRRLPCDTGVVAEKRALDEKIGKANLEAAAAEKPMPPAEGTAGYAGMEECGFCHKAAVDFWTKTRHAEAWKTLEGVGKQWNRDCIGCHVTGWQEPGGATLAHNDKLRDVQCENCHGPASMHVDKEGKDQPRTVSRAPERDLCVNRCHTPEHSDTFQLEAYLRDVTGPGHGEKLRRALGDGPTGHELRSAAIERAGHELGAGCPK